MLGVSEVKQYCTLAQRCDLVAAEITLALFENQLAMNEKLELPKVTTAAGLAILDEDGWATAKQWRRANKRLRKLSA